MLRRSARLLQRAKLDDGGRCVRCASAGTSYRTSCGARHVGALRRGYLLGNRRRPLASNARDLVARPASVRPPNFAGCRNPDRVDGRRRSALVSGRKRAKSDRLHVQACNMFVIARSEATWRSSRSVRRPYFSIAAPYGLAMTRLPVIRLRLPRAPNKKPPRTHGSGAAFVSRKQRFAVYFGASTISIWRPSIRG